MPQTIQIYLPNDDPRGLRIAKITTRIVQVIETPRTSLDRFFDREESRQPAVYLLIGQSEEGEVNQLYVGQTEALGTRLRDHHREQPFWDRALVIVSLTNSLTQTHIKYLEWYCLKEARAAGRFTDENGNASGRPHTPEHLENECLDIFATARVLVSTLGYPVFEPVVATPAANQARVEFVLTAAGTQGRGLHTSEGFVVLEGSIGRLANVPSIEDTSDARMRQALLDSGVMRAEGDRVIFPKSHLFRSPSSAATALTGRTSNGWMEWKTSDGRTLDSVVRRPTA